MAKKLSLIKLNTQGFTRIYKILIIFYFLKKKIIFTHLICRIKKFIDPSIAYDISNSKSSNIQIKCYDRICELVANYCDEISNRITNNQQNNPDCVLEEFVKSWMMYKDNVLHWIFKIFSYIVNFFQNFPS